MSNTAVVLLVFGSEIVSSVGPWLLWEFWQKQRREKEKATLERKESDKEQRLHDHGVNLTRRFAKAFKVVAETHDIKVYHNDEFFVEVSGLGGRRMIEIWIGSRKNGPPIEIKKPMGNESAKFYGMEEDTIELIIETLTRWVAENTQLKIETT